MTRKSRTIGNFAAGGGKAFKWILDHAAYQGDECLTWPFGRASNGYGSLSYKGKRHSAHRLMCTIAHGDALGMLATHSCGNGHLGCVNPRHLRWGTNQDNMADKIAHDTHRRGERQWSSKLNEEAVRQIKGLLSTQSKSSLARKFRVSRSAITDIAQGRTWSWL
jgi:hypothetical protein